MKPDEVPPYSGSRAVPQAPGAAAARRTLIFANDKSSGKTTTANAVIVSLLDRHPALMQTVNVREYDRQPRLATIFQRGDGLGSMTHHDARNAQAFDANRAMAHDPNATAWDDLLYNLGAGGLIVDLGANIFADICRILDDEPRPIFPDDGAAIGVVVPVTTARDSIESAITVVDTVCGWGERVQVFVVQQEYLGRLDGSHTLWAAFRARVQATQSHRLSVLRIEKLPAADIGRVVFQRIDRMVAEAEATLQSTGLQGAEYIRAVRKARAELAWGAKTLDAVHPVADWFAQ